jgi:hypothetical protein
MNIVDYLALKKITRSEIVKKNTNKKKTRSIKLFKFCITFDARKRYFLLMYYD